MPKQLCWNCKNACGGCSWSRDFTPVIDWTATPTKIIGNQYIIPSYSITACPEYISELDNYSVKTNKQIADELGINLRTYYRKKKKGTLNEIDTKKMDNVPKGTRKNTKSKRTK